MVDRRSNAAFVKGVLLFDTCPVQQRSGNCYGSVAPIQSILDNCRQSSQNSTLHDNNHIDVCRDGSLLRNGVN